MTRRRPYVKQPSTILRTPVPFTLAIRFPSEHIPLENALDEVIVITTNKQLPYTMATEAPPADNGVDVTPIVVNSERRDSLDKKLQLRPDETDLKNRHILLDNTAAPALQARAAELERQRITDNLKKVYSS